MSFQLRERRLKLCARDVLVRALPPQCERARLTAQAAALPLAELRALDAITADRARVQAERRDVAERLDALPSPTRSALGRPRDPHVAERARLTAAVGAADQQIAALDTQADRLQRTIGPAAAIQQERAGLDARIGELDHDIHQVRDELAERDVAQRPAWTRELLGERPDQYVMGSSENAKGVTRATCLRRPSTDTGWRGLIT